MRKFKLFVLLLGIFSLFGLHNVKAAPEAADVKVTYYLDGSVAVAETTVSSINVGDLVSLTKPEAVSGNFMFWTVNGAVRRDLPETLSIKASSKLVLKAYYTSSGTKVGVFLDSNLQYISATYANTAVPPTTNLPNKPHSTLDGWALVDDYSTKVTDFTLTADKTFFVARYTISDTEKVTVNGVEYVVNSLVTLTSELTNPVWKNASGQVVGYGQSFTFTALENATFTPEASVAPAVDYVTFRGPITLRTGYKTYVGKFDVGTKEVVDFGFILDNMVYASSSSLNPTTKEFLMSFETATTARYAIGAYVTYMDGTIPKTKMSAEVVTVAEELLYSYNFLDGGDSSNSAYANTNLTTNVSYASDNPGGTAGTTEWIADYANLNMTTETRLGGKLTSTEYSSPNANIRTNFNYDKVVTKVEILGARAFEIDNVGNVYLQQSSDNGVTWTTVANYTGLTEIASTISFDNLDIPKNSRIKLVVDVTASTKNSGLSFTGIKVYGLTAINHAKKDLDVVSFAQTEYSTATNLTLPTIGSVYGSTINWVSSHPAIISNTGVMVLPENTTLVTLTATATYGTQTFSKTYGFTVVGIGTRLQTQLDGLNTSISNGN